MNKDRSDLEDLMLDWGRDDLIEAGDNVLAVIDSHERLGEAFDKLDPEERALLHQQILLAIYAGISGDDFFADMNAIANEGAR